MSNDVETVAAAQDGALKTFILDGMADELTDLLVEALEKALQYLGDEPAADTLH